MKQRLAKKIVKASPLYKWYCNLFGKKPYKHQYWSQKWQTRSCIEIYHQEGKTDYRLRVASRKVDKYCQSILTKIKTRRTL